jgi:hypothetical protein
LPLLQPIAHQLRELSLVGHLFTKEGEGPATFLRECPNLKNLSVYYTNAHWPVALPIIVQSCPLLERFDFDETTIKTEGVTLICKELQCLQTISLANFDQETTDEAIGFLANPPTICLTSCFRVTDEGLKRLAAVNNHIKSLDLRGCKEITNEGLLSLFESQPNGLLQTLRLGTYRFGSQQCHLTPAIVDSMIAKFGSSLTDLYLMNCHVDETHFLKILQGCPHIRQFGFKDGPKGMDVPNQALQQIGHYWGHSLEELILSYANVTNEGVLTIMEGCQRQLRVLQLDACRLIDDEALAHIAQFGRGLRLVNFAFCTTFTEKAKQKFVLDFPYCGGEEVIFGDKAF